MPRVELPYLLAVARADAELESHLVALERDQAAILLEAEVLELADRQPVLRAEDQAHVAGALRLCGDLPDGLIVDLDPAAARLVGLRQLDAACERAVGRVEPHLKPSARRAVVSIDGAETAVSLAERHVIEPDPRPVADAVEEGPLPLDPLLRAVVDDGFQHQRVGGLPVPGSGAGRAICVQPLHIAREAEDGRLPARAEVHAVEPQPVAVLEPTHGIRPLRHAVRLCRAGLRLQATGLELGPDGDRRRVVEIVAEAEGAALGEVLRSQLGAGAGELRVEQVVVLADVHAHRVVPQAALEGAWGGPQQVVVEFDVARARVEVHDAELVDAHREDVVGVVHRVAGHQRVEAVEGAAAGVVAGEEAGVAGLEHAIVEVVVGEEGGHVVHRAAVARCLARAVAVEVEEVASRVPHGVEGDDVAADEEVLPVVEVAHRVGDGVEVVAGVVDLVDQAVVDRVVVAAQVEAGAGAVADAAVQERIVAAAHEDARLAGAYGVAAVLDLADAVEAGEVGDVGEIAAFDDAVGRAVEAHRGGVDRQAADADVCAVAQVEGELAALRLDIPGLAALLRDEVEGVVLPVPLAWAVEGVAVADDHPAALLGLVAPVGAGEPPRLRAIADDDLAGLRALDDPCLCRPTLVVDAVVQRALPVVVGLALEQLAHHAAG